MKIQYLTSLIILGLYGCGASDNLTPANIQERLTGINGTEISSKKALLLKLSNGDFDNQIHKLIEQEFADARINAIFKGNHKGFKNYSLAFNGTPLCDGQIRLKELSKSANPFALAHLPSRNLSIINDREIDLSKTQNLLRYDFETQEISAKDITILKDQECYYADSAGGLTRAKKLELTADELTYSAIVSSDKVLSLSPMFFDATGSAKVYINNPSNGKMKTFSLPGLVSDGTLENDYFTTSTTGTKAEESDFAFNYSSSDGRFDETSLFVHANEQLSFFKKLGYDWSGSDKLNIFVHAVVQGSVNNALYTPASGDNPPKIQVGDGDGIRLKNLPKDADVVRHEFGHHVVYDTLKSTKGESLVMHEGLADYFAFAFSNDACLGESICPEDSPINCEVANKCLRSGSNDYVLNKNTKPEAHFKSQFVSGMLWDLRSDIAKADLTQIVYDGVGMLLEESGYHDLVLGLLLADKDLFDGKYCEKIYAGAIDRGLESYISDIGCGSDLPELSALDNSGGETSSSSAQSSGSENNKGGIFGCGVVGYASPLANLAFLIVGFALPLTLRKRRRIE